MESAPSTSTDVVPAVASWDLLPGECVEVVLTCLFCVKTACPSQIVLKYLDGGRHHLLCRLVCHTWKAAVDQFATKTITLHPAIAAQYQNPPRTAREALQGIHLPSLFPAAHNLHCTCSSQRDDMDALLDAVNELHDLGRLRYARALCGGEGYFTHIHTQGNCV